jgi:NAD(P)H-hydrate epimerase
LGIHALNHGDVPVLLGVPAVSAAQMREIDRLAIEDFGIELAQMMELAGAALAGTAAQMLGRAKGSRVTVLVGPGNNGGGGLVAARHLANRGSLLHVVLSRPVRQLAENSRRRVATLIAMDVPACVIPWDLADGELEALMAGSDLLIDALLGYAAAGSPRGAVATIVEKAVASGTNTLSLDLPSGIDPDTGEATGLAITATATMTLALPKLGLLSESGRRRSGSIYLADIGLPEALYRRSGIEFDDPFSTGPLVRLA